MHKKITLTIMASFISIVLGTLFIVPYLSAQVGPTVFTPRLTVSPGPLTVTTGDTTVEDLIINGTCTGCTVTPPGGSNTQVQYNNSGAFGGDAGFTYDAASDTATAVNVTSTGTVDANAITATSVSSDTATVNGQSVCLENGTDCPSLSPGGSSTQLQYNNGGAFGGISGVTFNSGTGNLALNPAGTLTMNPTGASIALTTTTFTWNTNTLFTTANDGAGSGLDADLLDGNSSGAFPLLASATNTFSGTTNGNRGMTISNASSGNTANVYYEAANDAGRSLLMRITSTGYSGSIITGAPTGELGVLYTAGAVGLSIGTNGAERIQILSDGSVLNLKATAVQANGSNVCTANGTNCPGGAVTTSSYTGTVTGCTTNPAPTITYAQFGPMVIITIPPFTCTSNGNTFEVTGAPVAIRPASACQIQPLGRVTDNGTVTNTGYACMSAGGALAFGLGTSSAFSSWTVTGTKGTDATQNIVYNTSG